MSHICGLLLLLLLLLLHEFEDRSQIAARRWRNVALLRRCGVFVALCRSLRAACSLAGSGRFWPREGAVCALSCTLACVCFSCLIGALVT